MLIHPIQFFGLQGPCTAYPNVTIPFQDVSPGNKYGLIEVAGAAGNRHSFGLGLTDDFTVGNPVRIVGVGVEITDKTAIINRQGNATYYRCQIYHDTESQHDIVYINGVVPQGDWGSVQIGQLPPPTISDIALLPTMLRRVNAEEGAYQVGLPNPHSLKRFCTITQQAPTMFQNTITSDNEGVILSTTRQPAWTNRTAAVTPPDGITHKHLGVGNFMLNAIIPAGTYFQGLHELAAFEVVVKWRIEVIPMYDSARVTLSQFTARFDIGALEAYALFLQQVPAGATKAENPFGEWFDKTMSILAGAAGTIGGFFGPVGGLIGGGIASGLSFAGDTNKRAREQFGQKFF